MTTAARRPSWVPVADRKRLEPSAIQIWGLQLSALTSSQRRRLARLVAPAERERARRFRFDADRHRHLAGRGLVRMFLREELGGDPTSYELVEGPYEKPQLGSTGGEGLDYQFNVAHAGEDVLAAFRRRLPVGVDVEPLGRTDGSDGVAERVLTAREFRRWKSVDREWRAEFFMRVWTCKEALIKATGEGLQRPPETIECEFDGEQPTGVRRLEETETDIEVGGPSDWAVHSFDIEQRAAAAVAWRADENPPDLQYFDATDAARRRG